MNDFTHFRQLQRIISAVERVDITLEQACGCASPSPALAEWLGRTTLRAPSSSATS